MPHISEVEGFSSAGASMRGTLTAIVALMHSSSVAFNDDGSDVTVMSGKPEELLLGALDGSDAVLLYVSSDRTKELAR